MGRNLQLLLVTVSINYQVRWNDFVFSLFLGGGWQKCYRPIDMPSDNRNGGGGQIDSRHIKMLKGGMHRHYVGLRRLR